jgi:hypothetical protein
VYEALKIGVLGGVTDGTGSRALRSHNPPTSVSGRFGALQNRLAYAGLVAHGCARLLSAAPWVVSEVVSTITTVPRRRERSSR